MSNRKRLGLIFSYNDQWIGGTYYTINLVQAFKVLPNEQQPEIIVFSNQADFDRLSNETSYPYLTFELLDERPLPKWQRGVNRLLNRKMFRRAFKGHLDALFLFQQCGYLNPCPWRGGFIGSPIFKINTYHTFLHRKA
jgi:hypothetical protein